MTTIRVRGHDGLERLADRLDRAGAELPGRLTASIRGEASPALSAVRAAWLGVEVESSAGGGSSSGLRARTAAATEAEPIPRGVRIEVDGEAIDPAYGRNLAWYLDGYGRWRHPTWGRSPWQQQRGERVFHPALYAHEDAWRDGLERVNQRVAREIEG